ncbi:YceI family protein [Gordonia sp. CPCC 205515]|uniref:YceI family protein n=1 Tax=Gordonia sp. CPCC 205515 TaxID=3140791 RepID=UPI003AF35B78
MPETTWELTAADGAVRVHTDVAGRAARTGHRLTIGLEQWTATVTFDDDEPTGIEASIAVDSLKVESGEGGLTPMSGPEKMVARGNALKSLKADKFPDITYSSSSITKSDNGYHVDGTLTIHGKNRPQTLDLTVDDVDGGREISTEATITQTDFGIKPYSLMMGTLKVADDVRVEITVTH